MTVRRAGKHDARVALAAVMFALTAMSIVPAAWIAPVAAATGWANFGTPTATSSFDGGVTFRQPVTLEREIGRAEVLLTVANTAGPTVFPVPAPGGTGNTTLTNQLDPAVAGHLLPNTPLTARWRLISADDPTDVEIGPEVRLTYVDDRFVWRTEAGALVRVHWYEGGDAFGARALRIGEDAVRDASELLQVAETDPIDFFVYADQAEFYDALGPGTRENVGGQANAEIRTMFALISPNEIDDAWVGVVIPHELTHLVFDTAAGNPYHFPPRWLNEGLAVYLSESYGPSDRGAVEHAAGSGTLIPLDGLTGQFPTSYERFLLAYAESVSAVDYLIRTHGRDALVTLIRSYADGRTDDEAFTAALGLDITVFGSAWLDELGATAPTRFGPQPAPSGPIPAAWQVEPGATAPPGGSGAAPASATASNPRDDGVATADGGGVTVFVLALAIVALAIGAAVVVRRRRAGPGTP